MPNTDTSDTKTNTHPARYAASASHRLLSLLETNLVDLTKSQYSKLYYLASDTSSNGQNRLRMYDERHRRDVSANALAALKCSFTDRTLVLSDAMKLAVESEVLVTERDQGGRGRGTSQQNAEGRIKMADLADWPGATIERDEVRATTVSVARSEEPRCKVVFVTPVTATVQV